MFFNKILSWVNQLIPSKTWYAIANHSYFGEIGYHGFSDERIGYWECEIDVEESVVSVIINSITEELPTDAHQNFVESIVKDLDSTIAKIKQLMLNILSNCEKIDRNTDWYQLFRLTGIEVPIDADIRNDWAISFECLVDEVGHHFSCHFKNGKPEFVSVDG